MTSTSYSETLDYLFRQLPMFQHIGAPALKKDLTNIIRTCRLMDNPQEQFRSIHLAGTNGKGSTAHMIAAVLQRAGYRVGLYTSPHYKDFRERIKINGKLISRKAVVDFVGQYKGEFESFSPSFFEISVALAFHHFARQKVDFAIVETGLGGRLDSTNILMPELAIITNISYDHQQWLGDTLELIAQEKAGIIKAGVPVVIGETHEQTVSVFRQKARALGSPIYFADQLLRADLCSRDHAGSNFSIWRQGELWLKDLKVDILAEYQALNLQTALQSLLVLKQTKIVDWTEAHLRGGLAGLRKLSRLLGRWQMLGKDPLIIADSAHNVGGLRLAIAQLLQTPHDKLHIVLGTVYDKDLSETLSLFPTNARYYFAKADVPRGLDAKVLQSQANQIGLKGRAYRSVRQALQAARRQASKKDLIFIGGSIFVVAEVL